MKKGQLRKALVDLVPVVAVALLFFAVTPRPGAASEIGIDAVAVGVKDGSIWRIEVRGDRQPVEYQDLRRKTS